MTIQRSRTLTENFKFFKNITKPESYYKLSKEDRCAVEILFCYTVFKQSEEECKNEIDNIINNICKLRLAESAIGAIDRICLF